MVFRSGWIYPVTGARNGFGSQRVNDNAKDFRRMDVRCAAEIVNRADGYGSRTLLRNGEFDTLDCLFGPPRSFRFGARFTF